LRKIAFGIALLCFLISCYSSIKQEEPLSNKLGISEEEMNKRFLYHRRLMYEAFEKYIAYSDFRGENGRVTAESVERFKELFLDNAKVWNDYAWEPELIGAKVYADYVYFYHRIKGLKVEYEKDILNKFFSGHIEDFNPKVDTTDPSNHTFRYEFRVKKWTYYILNKENKVIYYDEPIEYELDFIFYVSSKEKWAKIMDILPAT
jgi:hypothetical protein